MHILYPFPMRIHAIRKVRLFVTIAVLAATMLSACDYLSFTRPQVSETGESPLPTTDASTDATAPIAQPESPTQAPDAGPTHQVYLPEISQGEGGEGTPEAAAAPGGAALQLAYLSEGNLWLIDIPPGSPQQLTQSGDLLSFAWAPDGSRLATFNGRTLCQLNPDGSEAGCIKLDLDDFQAQAPRQIAWAPDLSSLTLWNPADRWDAEIIGWIIIPLNGSDDPIYILDPVEWGAVLTPDNEPGGVTGEALYLADSTLIGTFTHNWLCGEGGCHYQLYYFDFAESRLMPYPNKPEEGFSEGMGLVLSAAGSQLYNFGTFHTGCESYITFVDAFDLTNGARQIYDFPQQAINGLAISPDGTRAVIAHNVGCSTQNQDEWAQACGLAQGFDVYPMQLWDLASSERNDLPPGTQPTWSSDGRWLAFRSCLSPGADNSWSPTNEGPPGVYILDWNDGVLVRVADGENPRWKP